MVEICFCWQKTRKNQQKKNLVGYIVAYLRNMNNQNNIGNINDGDDSDDSDHRCTRLH